MAEDVRKIYQALFEISGKVDKSLVAAARDAKQLLKGLDLASGATDRNVSKVLKDLGHITGMSGRLKHTATEFGNAWSQAAGKAHRAFEPLHRMIGGIGTITGIGAGLGAIGGLFETAQIAKEAWGVHAEREQSRLLLDTVLKNRGLGGQAAAFNEMLLRFTSDEAKIDYNTAFQSAQMMMNTGRFKGVADVHKVLSQMADIGGAPEQSKLGLMAISKMLSEGRIEGRHLQELGFDLPQVGWYQEIAKIRGEDVGQLRKEMAHKGSSIDADVLLQVLQAVTGPGGALQGHALAQMTGPAGEQARMIARWQTLLDSIGKIEDKAVTPILTKLLGDVDVVRLSTSLQGAADAAEMLGRDLGTTYDTLRNTGELRRTSSLLKDIASQFGAAFGIKGGNTVQTLTGIYGKLNETLSWVNTHFKDIVFWSKAAAEAFLAINAIKFTAGIVSSIAILSKAVMDLKTSALGAKGAMEGLSGAKGGLLGAGIFGELSGAAAAAAIATAAGKAFDRTFKPPYYEPKTKQYDWSVISPEGMPSADLQKDAAKEQERAAETSAKSAQNTATSISLGAGYAAQIQTSIAAAATEARRLATILSTAPGLGTPGGAPPAPHVEGHALGGLFRRRHLAMIGESGPEAVLPLSNRVRASGILGSAGMGGITFAIAPAEVHIHGSADKATVQAAIDGAYRKVVNDIQRILDESNHRRSFEAFA